MVGIPILIHLINMMRHRRVPWAAMEFLLLSQKKNRTWIIFKQLLLLLLRMAAVALVVLVLAQPLLSQRLGAWLGGVTVHHIVLLDDSYSMSDHWGDTSGLEEGKRVVQEIAAEAGRQIQPQQFTLLRFSHARWLGRGAQADLLQEPVRGKFGETLREKLAKIGPSESAAGPADALEVLAELLGEPKGQQRIIYLVSDYRTRDWNEAKQLRDHLKDFDKENAQIVLVNCVEGVHSNLAVTALTPAEGIRAKDVRLGIEVTVQNYGAERARNVAVSLEEDGQARPGVLIKEIPAGKSAKEQFLVSFATQGEHTIAAHLESDAVAADNSRYCVVNFPDTVPVLYIDGNPDFRDARHLAGIWTPGGALHTGVDAKIEDPRYLSRKPLAPFQAIYLLNIERLEESAVKALEEYVAGGGGVAFFLGPRSPARFFNEALFREGKGLFPLPLAGPSELPVDRLEMAPDVEVTDHPIFFGQGGSDLAGMFVERYFSVPKRWEPPKDSSVRVIARLRNGAPLAVERRFGQGRVVAFLTTASPVWNNFAQTGHFWGWIILLQPYLTPRPAADAPRIVGAPLRLDLDVGQYTGQVRFTTPEHGASAQQTVEAVAAANGTSTASLLGTDMAGLYEAQLTRRDGGADVRRFAVNVDPAEGDMKQISRAQLDARLEGVRFDYQQASRFQYSSPDLGIASLSQFLFYALIVLLVCEQVLAWAVSYHPPQRHAVPAAGGVR